MPLKVNYRGTRNIARGLTDFRAKVDRGVSRIALTKAQRPIVRTAKQNVVSNKRTGQLRRSLGSVVRTYKGVVLGFIGPRRGSRFEGTYKGKRIRPSKYAHLVNAGFIHWKTGARVEGNRFLDNAIRSKMGEVESILAQETEANFHKVLERSTKRFRRQIGRL